MVRNLFVYEFDEETRESMLKHCESDTDRAYMCFKTATNPMYNKITCPEVIHAEQQGADSK